jgi:hypothetical protein
MLIWLHDSLLYKKRLLKSDLYYICSGNLLDSAVKTAVVRLADSSLDRQADNQTQALQIIIQIDHIG